MVAIPPRKYEIFSPDPAVGRIDAYSIASTSEVHAAAAVILFSEGRFALRLRLGPRQFGRVICPTFSRSGDRGLEDWWRKRDEFRRLQQRVPFFTWIEGELRGIADALETVQLEAPPTQSEDLALVARNLAEEMRAKLASKH